jgi:hypothetical protein
MELTPMDFDVALQRQLSDRQRKKDSNVERVFSRRQIEQAFLESFEMIGGVPRLAIWANKEENYGQFLALMMKLAPKEAQSNLAGQVLEYRSNIPSSPLNRPPSAEIEEGEIVE